MPVSRDFRGRRRREAEPDRLPPGQYVTDDFPVLSAGPTPHMPVEDWTFSVVAGDERKSWSWDDFQALPAESVTTDITASRGGRSSTRRRRASPSTRSSTASTMTRRTRSRSATAATRPTCRSRI